MIPLAGFPGIYPTNDDVAVGGGSYTGSFQFVRGMVFPIRASFTTPSVPIAAGYTDPGIANVKLGTSYDFNFATLVGTYDGSDRWTDPGEANVRLATAYKANSLTNNKTGLLDLPAEADVKIGTQFDQLTKTGTYDGSDRWSDPGIASVAEGVQYKANSLVNNRTGTLRIVYRSHATFSINALDQLEGSLWATLNDNVLTATIGPASYVVYDKTGALVGISESGLSPDANGIYHITPVTATVLGDLTHYLIRVSIEAGGQQRIIYKGIRLGE